MSWMTLYFWTKSEVGFRQHPLSKCTGIYSLQTLHIVPLNIPLHP